ncbi:hypothetical protein K435DRAFT_880223 [Dendrothele bispora CBS 962.96]|uniref:Ribonuclease H1 N-terminal domain-containing protein n=1 Tax=Dendrothele bispora (strain CBS 962.96) TaxID=1314807 RepID=A0A4S8KJT0_DENBC|nr:hypothetical protein K435DRAFT_880223 [Dendrothele bispora CBS 962.96]
MPNIYHITVHPGDILVISATADPTSGTTAPQSSVVTTQSSVAANSSNEPSLPPLYNSTLVHLTQGSELVYYAWNRVPSAQEIKWRWLRGLDDRGYVVACGTQIGFFADWSIVKALTHGVSNMFQKRFNHFNEALLEYAQVLEGTSSAYLAPCIMPSPSTVALNSVLDYHNPDFIGQDLEFTIDSHSSVRVSVAEQFPDPPHYVNHTDAETNLNGGNNAQNLPINISDDEGEEEI